MPLNKPGQIDLEFLADEIYVKRDGRPLRGAADEIGVSAATLCRIQKGHEPDADSYLKICHWLGTCPGRYSVPSKPFKK